MQNLPAHRYRQRPGASRTPGTALTAFATAAALWGCRALPESPRPEILSGVHPGNYVEKVANVARDLTEAVGLPPDARDRQRAATGLFLASWKEYTTTLGAFEARALELRPHDVVSGNDRLARLCGDMARATTDMITARDIAAHHRDSPEVRANRDETAAGIEARSAVLSAASSLSVLLTESSYYLAQRHLRALESARANVAPAVVVLHVLSLARFSQADTRNHADSYHRAWREWMRSALKARDFTTALEIWEIAATGSGPLRGDAVEELDEMARACATNPPTPAVLAGIESILDRVDRALSGKRSGPPQRTPETRKLRAAILVVQAAATGDARHKIQLAGEAQALCDDFTAEISWIYSVAAHTLGSEAAADGRFVDGVRIYQRTLQSGRVDDIDRHVARFRSAVFHRASEAVSENLRRGLVVEARTSAEQLADLAGDTLELRQAKKTFRRVQHATVDHFLDHDAERALAVAIEALSENPSDDRMKRKADACRLRRLRKQIGDLSTSWERLGARKTRDMLHKASLRMSSSQGISSCRTVLDDVESAWVRELRETTDPDIAFRLMFEVAQLRGAGVDKATKRAADALWPVLDVALDRGDWELLERTIDVYFTRCPAAERPRRFKTGYVRFLEHLDNLDATPRLGRHLARYVLAYRRNLEPISRLLGKHMAPQSKIGPRLRTLVRRVAPTAPLLRRFATRTAAPRHRRIEPPDLVSEQEIAQSENWWNEPAMNRVSAAEMARRTTAATQSTPPRSDYASVGWSGFGGGLIALLALGWHTRKRGVLPFASYVTSALSLGAGVGFLLGLL